MTEEKSISERARERLILALDVPTGNEAMSLISRTRGHVGLYKVGLQLYLADPLLVSQVHDIDVMLDLKLHDIPNTVSEAVKRICDIPQVKFFTVHALGGWRMIEAAANAVRASGRTDLRMLAVTVLTSHSVDEWQDIAGRGATPLESAKRLATTAQLAGAHGIVCSPVEVRDLSEGSKQAFEAIAAETKGTHTAKDIERKIGPVTLYVCPGVRMPTDAAGDQMRVGTPQHTIRRGATHLVVGRPIRKAADPAAAARTFVNAIAEEL